MDNRVQRMTVSGEDSSMCLVLTDGFVCAPINSYCLCPSIHNIHSCIYHKVAEAGLNDFVIILYPAFKLCC